jgi:6-phosphogluconolactonase
MRSLFFVGSCNRPLFYFKSANGSGIASFWIDSKTGACTPGPVTHDINPTFVTFSSRYQTLLATTEVQDVGQGKVSAYRIAGTGSVTLISRQPVSGDTAAQVGIDRDSRFAAVANYSLLPLDDHAGASVVVYPIGVNGTLGTAVASARHEGSSADPVRQTQPHPHGVYWTPDNRYLIVPDLGTDRLVIYRFDVTTGAIVLHRSCRLPPGSGPRGLIFHPRLPLAYVALELTSRVATLAFDAQNGDFTLLHSESSTAGARAPPNGCSAIKLSPEGQRVFVGNRGEDSIARLDIDRRTGIARLAAAYASGGRTPRDFAFDPSGTTLVVCNQDSDRLAVFRYGADSGDLMPLGEGAVCGTPMAIAFAA